MKETAPKAHAPETKAKSVSGPLPEPSIPSSGLPDIKNTCPLCANEINSSMTKCPRCGVPLKSEVVPQKPSAILPSPPPVVAAPAPPKKEPEVPIHIPPPPPWTEPLPPPPEPLKRVEPAVEKVVIPPAEPRARSEGLVNGRGAASRTGMVNGRGMVNGTGLVNGTGMTNGLSTGDRPESARERRAPLVRRWQFLAVLVAIAVVLPTFIYLSYVRQTDFVTDGDFGEWSHVSKFGMQAPASLPEVTVDEWAIKSDGNTLNLYVKTATDIVATSNVDSFYLFVDSDGSVDSGYSVASIGADYMLEMHGWDQKIESASLMLYDTVTDRFNWTSWESIDSLAVAIDGEKLEATANLPVALTSDSRYVLLAQDNMLDQASSVSFPVPEKGGALIILQERGSGVSTLTGLIPATDSVSLARLVLRCEGTSGRVETIMPVVSGAGPAARIADISLSPGESQTVEIVVDTSSTASQSLVSTYVAEAGVSSTFEEVVVMGEPIRAYVSSPPTSIRIDGAFGDWAGHVVADKDNESVSNPNVNITAIGSVNSTAYAAFYVSVQGQVFEGSYVPSTKGKPTSQGGGGLPITPRRKTGEDFLRIYIDSDISNTTGQLVQRSTKLIGADYLLEVEGVNGIVTSRTLSMYSSGTWTSVVASVLAAADSRQVETSVPTAAIGGSTSFVAIVETTDWRSRSDWAWTGDILDPWTIDAFGNTYMSNDGTTWSYLGTPTLAPGDRVVDIAVSIGAQGGDIFLVTNTGRTFYWIPGTSTSWEVGQTNPIDTANYSEAESMTFYQNAGAWLLTRNGSYFWLMDAHKSSKEWTFQDVAASGITDFTDIVYSGGTMYALRTTPNTSLLYSNNGNSFSAVTNPTGATSNHTQFTYLEQGSGSSDDIIYVLCENGNIRYSSNGGQTWSALGNLPVPTGGNTTKYTALGIDPAGYMWVVTDTGYTYRSTDTTTYNSFVCTGRSPITSVVAILPTTAIPEFPVAVLPVIALLLSIVIPKFSRRASRKA